MTAKGSRGFSVIELVIVLALAAMVASFAVPSLQRSLALTRLQTSAVELAAELNFARTIALTRGAVFQLSVDTGNGTYQVVDPADLDHPPRTAKRLEQGIRFAAVPGEPIEFRPRGFARGGTLRLTDGFGNFVEVVVLSTGLVEVRQPEVS
ncbi:MAG: hypothetical protein Kow00109_06950 [Acidobacteriota bacterium]